MMTTTTQRLLDLAATAPDSSDEQLALALREAHELYQEGLDGLRQSMAARCAGLSVRELMAAVTATGMPVGLTQDREELVTLLALANWEMTPAALAYAQLAEDAARRGVCLIPEE